jgi:hypothetical protein
MLVIKSRLLAKNRVITPESRLALWLMRTPSSHQTPGLLGSNRRCGWLVKTDFTWPGKPHRPLTIFRLRPPSSYGPAVTNANQDLTRSTESRTEPVFPRLGRLGAKACWQKNISEGDLDSTQWVTTFDRHWKCRAHDDRHGVPRKSFAGISRAGRVPASNRCGKCCDACFSLMSAGQCSVEDWSLGDDGLLLCPQLKSLIFMMASVLIRLFDY